MSSRRLALSGAVLAALALAGCAPRQVVNSRLPSTRTVSSRADLNWRATPVFGTVNLRTGFSPDPVTRNVAAGGSNPNPVSGEGCEGYLNASAPDLDLNFTAGSLPLTISASSDMDISMVIYTPDGRWICDDDSGDALNPSVTFNNPRSGNYNIWIATYAATSSRPTTTVAFSELRRNAD